MHSNSVRCALLLICALGLATYVWLDGQQRVLNAEMKPPQWVIQTEVKEVEKVVIQTQLKEVEKIIVEERIKEVIKYVEQPAQAKPLFDNGVFSVDRVVDVYDGDTFKVVVAGWPDFFTPVAIRLRGIDSPEIRGKCDREKRLAKDARDYLRNLLRDAQITLSHLSQGKYFRIIADVSVNGEDLKTLLLSHGYARPYAGDKRLSWCD